MKLTLGFPLLLLMFYLGEGYPQSDEGLRWYEPNLSITRFEGQGWENLGYQRLPARAKEKIRPAVWSLSQQTAGLGIRFDTDADSLIVEYEVGKNLSLPHMPATGVSGVDLYVKHEQNWLWCRGKYQFKNTVQYVFVLGNGPSKLSTYKLYFPLYNRLTNLKIGVPNGHSFQFLAPRPEKPIVVYGTSIAQGACASRPGMAWTNILSRKMDYPLVNLGFSGNGRLEAEVIDFIAELDASVFVLDCLPNLSPSRGYTKDNVQDRLRKSISALRAHHPDTPILLVQHAGYSDGPVDSLREKTYTSLNHWTLETFEQLRQTGLKNLFILKKETLNLTNDAFVDGTHPTDLGMEQYAKAYEKVLWPLIYTID